MHLAECGQCSDFYERCQDLTKSLCAPAPIERHMPDDLRVAIMNAVTDIQRSEQKRTLRPFMKTALACAASLMLVAAYLSFRPRHEPQIVDASTTPAIQMVQMIPSNMSGSRAIFSASDLATRALNDEFEYLRQDIMTLAEKYNRFLETHFMLAGNDQ